MAVRDLQALVAEGRWLWTASPDPGDPVACATCHYDPSKTRGWAASFPKFKPLPPPHGRVMTLLQANAEAIQRHYGPADPLPAATAITAYLMSHGAGVPISPGISVGQPVFPTRMQALAASVARGERIFARRCDTCHKTADAASPIVAFPRPVGGRVEPIEVFLERHRPSGQPLAWDEQAMADLIAYLMSHLAGRPVGIQPEHATKGGP